MTDDRTLKREVRWAQRDVIGLLESDLYHRATRDERRPDLDAATSDEWVSPLGWRVRLTRPDLSDGPIRLDVVIYNPAGELFAQLEDVGSAHAVDSVLP